MKSKFQHFTTEKDFPFRFNLKKSNIYIYVFFRLSQKLQRVFRIVQFGHYDNLSAYLHQHGADININQQDGSGVTALIRCAQVI